MRNSEAGLGFGGGTHYHQAEAQLAAGPLNFYASTGGPNRT